MLDLTQVAAEERRTARAVENIERENWRYDTCLPRTITVPQSFLLESLASLTVHPVKVKRVGWRGHKTRIQGNGAVIKGICHMYLAMVLGSDYTNREGN